MRLLLLLSGLLAFAPGRAAATAPVYSVGGTLADGGGRPLTGLYLLEFELRRGGKDGPPLWEEALYVQAESGSYRVLLGKSKGIPEEPVGGAFLVAHAPAGSGWRAGEPVLLSVQASMPQPLPPVPAAEPAGLVGKPVPVPEPTPEKKAPAKAAAKPAPVEKKPGPEKKPEPEQKKPAPVMRKPAASKKPAKKKSAAPKAAAPAPRPVLKPKAPPAAPAARPGTYVVEEGDNLPSIAEKLYGHHRRWKDLYRANRSKLGRGGSVKPGQVLKVP